MTMISSQNGNKFVYILPLAKKKHNMPKWKDKK